MQSKVISLNSGFAKSYLIKDRKLVLVDTGMKETLQAVFEQMKTLGINPQDISLIIITHGHFDHFACIEEYKKLSGAPILCTKETSQAIQFGVSSPISSTHWFVKILANMLFGKQKLSTSISADIIIDQEMDLADFGVSGRILITPGHTDLSLSILLDTGETLVGDLFSGSFISPDKPRFGIFTKDLQEVKRSINKLVNQKADLFYCGHSGPYRKEVVLKYLMKKN